MDNSSLHCVLFMFFVFIFFHWSIFRLYLLILSTSFFVTKIIDVYNDKGKAIENINYVFSLKIQIVSQFVFWYNSSGEKLRQKTRITPSGDYFVIEEQYYIWQPWIAN